MLLLGEEENNKAIDAYKTLHITVFYNGFYALLKVKPNKAY